MSIPVHNWWDQLCLVIMRRCRESAFEVVSTAVQKSRVSVTQRSHRSILLAESRLEFQTEAICYGVVQSSCHFAVPPMSLELTVTRRISVIHFHVPRPASLCCCSSGGLLCPAEGGTTLVHAMRNMYPWCCQESLAGEISLYNCRGRRRSLNFDLWSTCLAACCPAHQAEPLPTAPAGVSLFE